MTIDWSVDAARQLCEIYESISVDSTRYVLRVVERITARTKQLAFFPYSGESVAEYRDERIRQVIVGVYRVIYRVESERIVVLSVIHGARLLPDDISKSPE